MRQNPTSIVITGAAGLLGNYSSIALLAEENVQVIALDRAAFAEDNTLHDALKKADEIWHFAGANRGEDPEIYKTNIAIATRLAQAITDTQCQATLYYANSTHSEKESAYGRSKKEATEILATACPQMHNLILPHIFGEGGKPFYNSVIATFCYQLAQGKQAEISHDGEIEPLHCSQVIHAIRQGWETPGTHRLHGKKMRVSEMLNRLTALHEQYQAGIFPNVQDAFDLHLFNTYRSYLYPSYYPVTLTKHTDTRGALVEAAKMHQGGQIFFSTTVPGITRGNHFHLHKIERFLVVEGQAEIAIRKIGSDVVERFAVSGEHPAYIDIPTLHTHNITNTGNTPLLTLFWTNEIFNADSPDTYPEIV